MVKFKFSCCYLHNCFFFFCRGCLLVRQSFFHNDAKYFSNNHGGFHLCRGFHSSFRATQGGLSLNIGNSFFHCTVSNVESKLIFLTFCYFSSDVSSTLIVSPGPVIDFLVLNQEVRDPSSIDWKKVLTRTSVVCLRLSTYLILFSC